MKKLFIFFLISIFIAGTLSAMAIREQQNDNDQQQEINPRGRSEYRHNHGNENEQRRENCRHFATKFPAQSQNEHRREFNHQNRGERPENRGERQREINPVTVSGVLKLERGLVAVESDAADVYFVPLLNRYIGFITGLSEGTRVNIEGFQFRNFIHPEKLTINGRTYDFPRHRYNPGTYPGSRHNPGNENRNRHNRSPN